MQVESMNSRSGGAFAARQRAEYPFPDAALRPAYKAVVERLLRVRRPHADSRPSARHSSGHGRSRSAPGDRQRAPCRAYPSAKSGPIRAHCASENQKKSDISIASSLETMNHASPALGIPLMGPDPSTLRYHGPTRVLPSRHGTGWRWMDAQQATLLAIKALGYVAADPERFGRFLAESGFGRGSVAGSGRRSRPAGRSPRLRPQRGRRWCSNCASFSDLPPEAPARARANLPGYAPPM